MSRKVITRRPSSGERRTIAPAAAHESLDLDDRPLSVTVSRDGKRLLVALPYELWVVNAATLAAERTIPVAAAEPTVAEAPKESKIWLGGHHLHVGSIFATTHAKVGTKLAGYVDRLALVRPGLLCGVGSQGEVLWDVDKGAPVHRRKAGEHPTHGLVRLGGRAVWADGSASAWVIEPEHPSGYTQLRLRQTSEEAVDAEGIVALGTTSKGRCILAARDGAIAWFAPNLRTEGERFPRTPLRQATPLAVCGDERWIYALRPRGLLQRFLIAQPPRPADAGDDDPPPLPEAQECRLRWPASCMTLLEGEEGPAALILGGPQAEGLLGRLWRADPESLAWQPLRLGARALKEPAPEPTSEGRKVPDFTPTRSKISGSPLAELKVDAILGARAGVLITTAHGSLLERPVGERPAAEVMPADTVILPAMIRPRQGDARPALLLWPGVSDPEREPPDPLWLVWGDSPRGWIELTTPRIREQGWSRPDLFPMQVALAQLPEVAGNRPTLNERWHDPEHFAALARECKRLLKVIW
ncbi:MAG: hypothetical protein KC420_01630 [Myxococcales bacterium]|nr:hypothetical protein [Myxococcales bacterium]MCB9567524.1 hypothetical protein [Myxococcales bacterium]